MSMPEEDSDAIREAISDYLHTSYREFMRQAEAEWLGDLDQFKPRGILEALGPLGDAEPPAPYAGPLRTDSDPGTLERRFADALAELEAPVDPRVWATTPQPCAPPPLPELPTVAPLTWPVIFYGGEELPPARWSRPLWMWP